MFRPVSSLFQPYLISLGIVTGYLLIAGSLAGQDSTFISPTNPLDNVEWITHPDTGKMRDIATIAVPEGINFTGEGGTQQIMEAMQNPLSGGETGMILSEGSTWYAVFEFDNIGYVKDDEKEELDADEIFETLLKGQKGSNEERRKRGWDTLALLDWARKPYYNASTNNLEWATLLQDQQENQFVNFNTRLLGRKGIMSVTLVVGKDSLDQTLPAFRDALTQVTYTSGNRYAEFSEGDKIAEYGLTALIVGGGAAVAAKAGIFKWLWKVIAAIVVGGAAFFKKLFTGKTGESSAPGSKST